MTDKYEIITVRCNAPADKSKLMAWGMSFRTERYDAEWLILSEAKFWCRLGTCVVVRPMGKLQRGAKVYEWRSFNGEIFERVEFG